MPTVVPHQKDVSVRQDQHIKGSQMERSVDLQIGEEEAHQEQTNQQERKRHTNPLVRLLLSRFKKNESVPKSKEAMLEMLQPSRYKPNDLEQMALDTKFTKQEVKFLYRAFKQECPLGIINEETFKEVYEKIFPLGDASKYAHLVFCAIDREKTGGITFGDFMEFLSVITKGSTHEKLMWSFHFYDVNQDGLISKEEMVKVTESIYELMGPGGVDLIGLRRIDRVFDTMDLNQDGYITIDEFISYCTKHDSVKQSLLVLP